LQFLAGLGLTIYTFRKNFKQKADERRISWYHKVVVDKAIELLFTYMDAERTDLEKSALACEVARVDNSISRSDVEALYKSALIDFQQRLRPVRADLTNYTLIFDRRLFEKMQAVMLTLDDKISEWFYVAGTSGTLRVPETVSEILSNFHRDVLSILRDYEFTTLPKLG
jgi:hypothetical protein